MTICAEFFFLVPTISISAYLSVCLVVLWDKIPFQNQMTTIVKKYVSRYRRGHEVIFYFCRSACICDMTTNHYVLQDATPSTSYEHQ